MPNRKKRLKKGMESIKKAIEEHKRKIAEGDEYQSKYCEKEVKGMEDQFNRKKKGVDK